jgi:hypothetical protein
MKLSVLAGLLAVLLLVPMVFAQPSKISVALRTLIANEKFPGSISAGSSFFSRDGKRAGFVEQYQLFVIDVNPLGRAKLLWRGGALAFSPAGESIYAMGPAPAHQVFLRNLSTGGSRLICAGASSALTLSPDGKTIAFLRSTAGDMRSLVLVPAEGGDERLVASWRLASIEQWPPAWSPNGGAVVVHSAVRGKSKLVSISIRTGQMKEVVASRNQGPLRTLASRGDVLADLALAAGNRCQAGMGAGNQRSNGLPGRQFRRLDGWFDVDRQALLQAARYARRHDGMDYWEDVGWHGFQDRHRAA